MAEPEGEPVKTYRGNCHCGTYVYELTVPEVTRADECNCSVCYKKGALWVVPERPSECLRWIKGDPATMSSYAFGRKLFNHSFCGTCGISLMAVGPGESKEPKTSINVRTFQHGQGVDIFTLERRRLDGDSLPPAYQPPDYTGPEPAETECDNSRLYHGACHCGAVRLALRSKPLDKTFPKEFPSIIECNCSFCQRSGAVWSYPRRTHLVVRGREHLAAWHFGDGRLGKHFCRTCGVHVLVEQVPLSDADIAALPERRRWWAAFSRDTSPVNLRLVHRSGGGGQGGLGLDVARDLDVDHLDGYGLIKPSYDEP
ncbi:glutathione-dependent formaldehyde-activating enzyme [Xylariaceae sp. FL0804]|nr:glutathione-dependent formaldehyde-activating enzyme [Xylariaceae sp. FL0804]